MKYPWYRGYGLRYSHGSEFQTPYPYPHNPQPEHRGYSCTHAKPYLWVGAEVETGNNVDGDEVCGLSPVWNFDKHMWAVMKVLLDNSLDKMRWAIVIPNDGACSRINATNKPNAPCTNGKPTSSPNSTAKKLSIHQRVKVQMEVLQDLSDESNHINSHPQSKVWKRHAKSISETETYRCAL
jgi:hypothetical protein